MTARSVAGGIGIAALLLLCPFSRAQVYPRWFLNPEEIPCEPAAIGVAPTGYYPDSTGGAFQNAVMNALRAEEEAVEGSKQFFSAGDGTAEVGTSVHETLDTSRLESLFKSLKTVRMFAIGEMTAVLAGTGGCGLSGGMDALVPLASLGTPAWTRMLPADQRFEYAVGISEPYYYESSSWLEAEKNGRLELARSLRTQVRIRQRLVTDAVLGSRYDAVWDETLTVTLRGARVVRRWRDPSTDLFMVLLRMPK